MKFDFPDEDVMKLDDNDGVDPEERWTLTFDGSLNAAGHGIGAVLTSPHNTHTPCTARLCFDCTNNMAEYEACVMGLEAAIDLKIKILEVFGDSALVIHHVRGDWETKHPSLIPYKDYILQLIPAFEEITLDIFPETKTIWMML